MERRHVLAPDSIGNRLYDLDRIRDGTFKKDQDEGCLLFPERLDG